MDVHDTYRIEFQYQNFYFKVAVCGLYVLLWIALSQLFTGLMLYPWLYWIIGAAVTLLIMVVFYRKTENSALFIKNGSFERTEKGYILITGREYRFDEVKRLCAWRSDLYGTVFWTLQIEAGKTVKIMSLPCRREDDLSDTELYAVFSRLHSDFPEMKQEQNADGSRIPYYYSL